MRRFLKGLALIVVIGALGLWINNSALLAPDFQDGEGPRLIAHRGLHQTFHREGLTNDTCTAARMDAPSHDFLENTLESMAEAFGLGADVVELDVHLTRDGVFAVFHDWTLECRTDGAGVTREAAWADLKALDVGYGYTADGGQSFPFRGAGVGAMPRLEEALSRFPDGSLLIDFKSNEVEDGAALNTLFAERPALREAVWGVYGGPKPVQEVAARHDELKAFWRGQTVACLKAYGLTGWTGRVPAACREATIYIPINIAPWLWGWPNRLMARFQAAGSSVVLIGPYARGDVGSRGLDALSDLARVPQNFPGYVQTDRIEVIGPALAAR